MNITQRKIIQTLLVIAIMLNVACSTFFNLIDPPPAGSDASFNRVEDFAESTAAYVYPERAQSLVQKYKGDPIYGDLYYPDYTKTLRWLYIDGLIKGIISVK